MADLPRLARRLKFLPVVAVVPLLFFGQASAGGPDKRMTAYFDCINYYADPAFRKLVQSRGLLTDSQILGEISKAEGYCQKQVAAAVTAVRETPDNGTQHLTDEEIRTQLRTMTAAGYVMTYGQQ